MKKEKIKINDYEFVNTIHIGDKELILAENMQDPDGLHYMTCEVTTIEGLNLFHNIFVGNDFTEIAGIYAERLKQQIDIIATENKAENIPLEVITAEKCNEDIFAERLVGKILVVNPSALRAEYRTASHQIIRCTGGNGANPYGHGSTIYGDRIVNGKGSRFEKCDILGELKSEYYPDWLKVRLNYFEEMKNNPYTFEYGGYHFIPIGTISKSTDKQQIPKHIKSDMNMGMWSAEYIDLYGKPKVTYSHKDFYSACGNIPCDVFRCVENGKLFLPSKNEMFFYDGNYTDYTRKQKNNTQRKSKKNKEMER